MARTATKHRSRYRSPKHFFGHLATKIRKRLGLRHSLAELDPDLANRPIVFEAPELTPPLIEAISLISPQFRLRQDEWSRNFWQLNQNAGCWGEFDALAPVLQSMPRPTRVLDIGPGMGRSAAFFKKQLDWRDVPFHLYDGDGSSTRYTIAGPRFEDSFCGDLDALRLVLEHNGIEAFEIFDAHQPENALVKLPGPYDLIYSFFAVGWHWSIEHFLDDLERLLSPRGVGAFTLHDKAGEVPGAVADHFAHRIVEFKRTWPRDRWSRFIVLSRDEALLRPLD
ncbi:MAG: class I SAM-dependent methyltransferase [Acidobacteriota bacterium]